jgi:hypothetical protein
MLALTMPMRGGLYGLMPVLRIFVAAVYRLSGSMMSSPIDVASAGCHEHSICRFLLTI